ncbi:MAG: TetR/AcrR family transcriptional regulator [Actinobacteria bacterium]|nr:MAG: TetR/AcrR family transcriptional regulator [Actinomycetota bacterium]
METRNRTSRTQAERSEATRGALIGAARRLFADRGYAEVGTEEIVRAAGVTRGALYHHFDGKAGLFQAVFEQIESELARRFAEEALSVPDAWEAMVAGLDMFLDVCREPEVRQIALIDAPAVLGWAAWREVESRYSLGLIRIGLENLVEAGVAHPQPIDPLAHAIMGMLTEAGLYVANAEDADVAKAEMREVLRGTLEGLRGA